MRRTWSPPASARVAAAAPKEWATTLSMGPTVRAAASKASEKVTIEARRPELLTAALPAMHEQDHGALLGRLREAR